MFPIIGKLSDWTVTDNDDGTKWLERSYDNVCVITFNRAIIHEDLQMIETLPESNPTKMMPYSID